MDYSEHKPIHIHHPQQQPSQLFLNSLQELNDLKSQLHNAADYCEKSFLHAKHNQKNMILESTKEYVCNAVVTVVNHLGSVSSNLNKVDIGFSQAELRIDSLEQRFLAYQLYSEKIALTKTRWSTNFPKSQSRYLSTAEKSRHDKSKNNKNMVVFEAEELPLFSYTYSHHKDSTTNANQVVPVRDTILAGGKGQKTSTFHFQQSSIQQQKKNGQIRRLSGSRNGHIMSLIRPSKRPS